MTRRSKEGPDLRRKIPSNCQKPQNQAGRAEKRMKGGEWAESAHKVPSEHNDVQGKIRICENSENPREKKYLKLTTKGKRRPETEWGGKIPDESSTQANEREGGGFQKKPLR